MHSAMIYYVIVCYKAVDCTLEPKDARLRMIASQECALYLSPLVMASGLGEGIRLSSTVGDDA